MGAFALEAPFQPAGDQPAAIEKLSDGVLQGLPRQTLLGVTGSGKTYVMASVIQNTGKPALILTHNKTLAAQLYREFKEFFPNNAVEYFVSYYDYYQPEAYVAASDTYIEKDSSINDEIDLMRLSATSSLMARDDVIVVASVSCIYGLGSPGDYREQILSLCTGQRIERNDLIKHLIQIQYERSDHDFARSTFRVRGDVVDVYPAYARNSLRIELFGDTIDRIQLLEKTSGHVLQTLDNTAIYPAKHFITHPDRLKPAIQRIEDELTVRVEELNKEGKILEAHRIEQRTRYDLEMLLELGQCKGIENYSRHLSGRGEGERPAVLLDYFPDDFIVFVDESHVTLPQIRGMYRGDRARKENLVNFGFRLPSALDNRPLFFEEFQAMVPQAVYISATPQDYEKEHSQQIVELIIRPTGLIDSPVLVKPSQGQIDDLFSEIRATTKAGYRTLVTTLTKRMAEELAEYLNENGIRVQYLHSEIETIERVEILHNLRAGEFDVLVGINLLREGLDLPEVALVAILDADKIGFLRSATSLIQTAGRAARNVDGRVIMYAEHTSDAMATAIDEMNRRRIKQIAHNEAMGITPRSIKKKLESMLERKYGAITQKQQLDLEALSSKYNLSVSEQRADYIRSLEEAMHRHAEALEFEEAAQLRDAIHTLRSTKKQ
jgi:excinuclease ABC subunit B